MAVPSVAHGFLVAGQCGDLDRFYQGGIRLVLSSGRGNESSALGEM